MVTVMRNYIKYAVLAVLLIGMIVLAAQDIRSRNTKLQLNEIELKSKETQLIELNQKYDQVLKLKTKTEKEKDQQLEQIKQLEDERQRLEQELSAKRQREETERLQLAQAEKRARGTNTAQAAQKPRENAVKSVTGDKSAWMTAAGISDHHNANIIVNKESTWRVAVVNGIGCIGLIQACPAGLKPVMVANCPNWQTDPVCQLRVAENYMKTRYGSWAAAVSFHLRNNWW